MKLIIYTSGGRHEFDLAEVEHVEIHDKSGPLYNVTKRDDLAAIQVRVGRTLANVAVLPLTDGVGIEIVGITKSSSHSK